MYIYMYICICIYKYVEYRGYECMYIYIICIQSFMFKPKLLCIFYLYLSMCCRHLAAVYPRYAGDFLTSLELRWKLSSGGNYSISP